MKYSTNGLFWLSERKNIYEDKEHFFRTLPVIYNATRKVKNLGYKKARRGLRVWKTVSAVGSEFFMEKITGSLSSGKSPVLVAAEAASKKVFEATSWKRS